MGSAVTVTETVSPSAAAAARMLGGKKFLAIIGASIKGRLKKHFKAREKESSVAKRAGHSRNFWYWAYRRLKTTNNGKVVIVKARGKAGNLLNGMRTGKTIRVKKGKYMTIPISPEAFRVRRPGISKSRNSDVTGVHWSGAKLHKRGLQMGTYAGRPGMSAFTPHFALVKQVSYRADPRAVPQDAEIVAAVERGADAAYRKAMEQAARQGAVKGGAR